MIQDVCVATEYSSAYGIQIHLRAIHHEIV